MTTVIIIILIKFNCHASTTTYNFKFLPLCTLCTNCHSSNICGLANLSSTAFRSLTHMTAAPSAWYRQRWEEKIINARRTTRDNKTLATSCLHWTHVCMMCDMRCWDVTRSLQQRWYSSASFVRLTITQTVYTHNYVHVLTPWVPAVPKCCCSKGSTPYWSNPPFSIFDIRALQSTWT